MFDQQNSIWRSKKNVIVDSDCGRDNAGHRYKLSIMTDLRFELEESLTHPTIDNMFYPGQYCGVLAGPIVIGCIPWGPLKRPMLCSAQLAGVTSESNRRAWSLKQ